MSISGSRAAAAINLDDFERRLRAAGTPHSETHDPLSELAALVESTRAAVAAATPVPTPVEVQQQFAAFDEPLEQGALRPAFDGSETDEVVPGSEAESEFEDYPLPPEPSPAPVATERRTGRWKLMVAGLAIAGVVLIGAAVALRSGHMPGLPKTPPFIAAAQGPTRVQPPSDQTVANGTDPGASLLKDKTQPAQVKVVNTEEQPVDLAAQTAAQTPSPTPSPTAAPGAPSVRGTIDTPVVIVPAAAAPPLAAQFPDPKPVRTVSLRPDGTPIPSYAPPVDAAAPPAAAEPPPAKPSAATKPAAEAVGNPQSSTPKLDLPTKLSPKSSARVVVAKTDTTAPGANDALPQETPTKIEKAAKAQKQAATEPAEAATASGGWAVQVAAPKSEAEAKSTLARLNAKYASALGGSTLGVHKAVVNGSTIYRLRVVGLSKADAAALCARLKGDGGDCFIAK